MADPKTNHFLAKTVAVLLALLSVGIPINEPFRFLVFFVAATTLATGRLRWRPQNWIAALLVAAVTTLASHTIPVARIQEGHNLFLRLHDGEPLQRGLPPDVYARMLQLFTEQYPLSTRCTGIYCWASMDWNAYPANMPDRPFAFSGDGIWTRPEWSRVVSSIGFSSLETLRLGAINELKYNWIGDQVSPTGKPYSDIARTTAPYFVVYRLPPALLGSRLCWTGEMMWERDGSFLSQINAEHSCREIAASDIGARVFAFGISKAPLIVELDKSAALRRTDALWLALRVAGCVLVVALLAVPTLGTVLVLALCGAAFLTTIFATPKMLTAFQAHFGGDDGLTHEGFGREIVWHAMSGNWLAALRGGEDVFYSQPGLRYFRAIERTAFGDRNYGYLLALSALPVAIYRLTTHVATQWVAAGLVGFFLLCGIGGSLGLDFRDYVYWTARGFAEPLGYMFFLLGLLFGLRTGQGSGFRDAALCGLLFAASVFLRSNLALAAAVFLTVAALRLLSQRRAGGLAALVAGAAPALLIPLHNLYFGRELVLLTSTGDLPVTLVMPPSGYFRAANWLLTGAGGTPDDYARVVSHLGRWLAGSPGGDRLIHAALLAGLILTAALAREWSGRALTATAFALQIPLLFWHPDERFALLPWLVTFLAITAYLVEVAERQRKRAGVAAHKQAIGEC